MKQYERYKESGVEWLGRVPEQWELFAIRAFTRLKSDKGHPKYEVLSVYRDYGVVKKDSRDDNHNVTSQEIITYKAVYPTDLVINKMKAWQGSMGISPYKGIVSPAYITCELNQEVVSCGYLHYLLRSNRYIDEYNRLSYGVRIGQWDMHYEDFKQIVVALPDISEQKAIAHFLDQKCVRIDKAISQKERVIELLNERRQIIIQRAVTRGLDPNVPMKESGVDWIGEIPEHWEVKAIKYIVFMQSGETIKPEMFDENSIYPVYGGNGFRGYTNKYTNEGNFVLIGRQGALCGNVNYASGKFFASEHAIVVYPLNEVNIYWLGETIRLADMNRFSQSAAQPGIAVSTIKNIIFPYPSIQEQNEIATYLDNVNAKIDKAIAIKRQEIEKLKEYKTVLIDAAVTGKIKIA